MQDKEAELTEVNLKRDEENLNRNMDALKTEENADADEKGEEILEWG